MNIHLKIREFVNKKGTEIIIKSALIGLLDDEHVFEDIESAPYKILLRNIIKGGYAEKLMRLGSYNTSDVVFLASQYARANLTSENSVLYALDCLAYGLGWIDKEPTLPTIPSQNNTHATTSSQQSESSIVSEPEYKEKNKVKNIITSWTRTIGWLFLKVVSFILLLWKGFVWCIKVGGLWLWKAAKTILWCLNEGLQWLWKTIGLASLYLKHLILRLIEIVKEYFIWHKKNKEDIAVTSILFCVGLFIVSVVAIIIGWYNDTGHAPVWTWLFWESIVIGLGWLALAEYYESNN